MWKNNLYVFGPCSVSGNQALMGMQDGSIRVQTLLKPFSFTDIGPYWCLPMHDAQTGRVCSLALTYENTQLLSVGDDGNFFLFSYMADEELQRRIAEYKAKLPSARVCLKLILLFNIVSSL